MSAAGRSRTRTTRKVLCFAAPIAIVIIALLLYRGCVPQPEDQPPPSAKEALFVPADLARLKGLDRDGVLEYCRTQIRPAHYEGILRGGHGALWAGEANAWDRVLLAVAALEGMKIEARVVPGDFPRVAFKDGLRWTIVRLDAPGDAEQADQPPADSITLADLPAQRPELFHTIQPVLVLEQEGGKVARISSTTPERVANWVYQPAVLQAIAHGEDVHYALKVGDLDAIAEISLKGCRRASLELSWRFKGQSSVWSRELFDRENARPEIPGHDAPRAGDRYALVLAAGPLIPDVLPTRIRMFELPGYTPISGETERELMTLGTKYHVDCDERTQALAAETKVEVARNMPRIVIAASEAAQTGPAGLSLDALADSVEARGKRSREFHVARGLATDMIESRIIFEARRLPVVSASTVFSNFKATSPDAPARRIALIESEAKRLLAHELIGATVKLEVMPPPAPSDDPAASFPASPLLMLERSKDGIALRGLSEAMPEPEKPWTKYRWEAEGRALFGDRVAELARVADALLCRHSRRADFLLQCTAVSAWPLDSLPVLAGSFLDYAVLDGKKEQRLGVRIGLKDGLPMNGTEQLVKGWPKVSLPGASGALLAPHEFLTQGEAVKVKVRVGETEREVAARKIALQDGAIVKLLDCATFPLVLAWEKGTASMALATASPVVQGKVLDRDSSAPVVAEVIHIVFSQRTEQVERARTPTAADGTYALLTAPTAQRLILILDRSGSMHWDLNPKRAGGDAPAKAGEQRMDHLKKEVRELLDKLPSGVEVALWSFSSGPLDRAPASPSHCREDCPFTTDLGRLRAAVAALKPDGGTPITGAVVKLLNHVKSDPLSRDAVVVLLTDGQNDSRSLSAPDAYRKANGKTVIHTIGFAIAPGSPAEKEMQELAQVSGGTYHLAGSGGALKLAFDTFRAGLLNVRLKVTSPCHAGEERDLKSADLGHGRVNFVLSHGCAACRCEGKTFLTVTSKNSADLVKCDALSPKARRMIEERVKDGAWTVTIPTGRVNIGPISAYGWFETEKATGRLVGRTEDGLHGALPSPTSFPEAVFRGGHAFLSWFQGIVNYTSGSVDAAFKWNRQPGYMSGGAEGFKRFVQVNALQFAVRWWNEFGWAAYPESIHAYWTGVCLNFTLQSMAFEMPSLDCFRHWGEALCDQLGDKAKNFPGEVFNAGNSGPLNKEFDDAIGDYLASVKAVGEKLIERAADKDKAKEEVNNLVGPIEKWKQDLIDRPIDKQMDCANRFRRPSRP